MLEEFKKFALKGNVVDMAIGVVIGTAFGKIVSSLVSDIIMPPIAFITGGIDLSHLHITLKQASEGVEAVLLNYGMFLNTILDFVIIAFSIFMVVKQMNRFHKKQEEEPKKEKESEEVKLLREIRDAVKK
jgi:large conductance mechanosensitive channel